jgi:3,4-dihydroxyphenylacetate 2,3-dioxygenase
VGETARAGEIVGAALVAHVPTIVMPEAERRALNHGADTTLVAGLRRIRAEHLDRLNPDTVVVFDTHWFTTFEHCVSAHDRRSGRFTSDELPRGMAGIPFDYPGDPELADAVAAEAETAGGCWVHASRDPYLPVHYPTINLLRYLQGGERWVSVGVCQTAEAADFLQFGQVLAAAVARSGRRVVLLASGGMSHRFWPLRQIRDHEASDPAHIISDTARAADARIIGHFQAGRHQAVIDGMPEYGRVSPEGFFGHYLMMAGALGGRACTAPGVQVSDYESAVGTGQVDVWFERPPGGWSAGPVSVGTAGTATA